MMSRLHHTASIPATYASGAALPQNPQGSLPGGRWPFPGGSRTPWIASKGFERCSTSSLIPLSWACPVASWAHARRYYFKSLSTDPERAREALAYIQGLFRIERAIATTPRKKRESVRAEQSRPLVEGFFAWCDAQVDQVLDDTPIAKAVQYARNQRAALERFLEDARLPIHNNWSELELRRQAVGRKNWLFVGSDQAADVNTAFVSLLASCQQHGIEPSGYLRDLFCLLPRWSLRRVLELSPACWRETLEQTDAQQRLDANIYRKVALGEIG